MPARLSLFSTILALVLLSPLALAGEATPPVAKVVPHEMTLHGDTRVDDYYWLKQRENPEVIAYLEAENDYTEQVMAHTSDFQEELFAEIKGRIQQDDATVPVKRDDFYYYERYEDGRQYAIHCRKPGTLEAEEEVILDVNDLASDHEFYSARSLRPSPSHDVIAFGEDITGRRKYTLRFKNLRTGQLLPDRIEMTTGSAAWANDGRTVFYVRKDPVTLRSHQVWRHTLGTPSDDDVLAFEETDDTFSCYVWKSKSKQFLMISSYHTLRSEVRYLDATDPTGEFTVFLPREGEHEYDLDHFGNHFYVRSNEKATNFRLMRTPIDSTSKSNWEVVIEHRDDVLLERFEIFRDHLVLAERQEGLLQLRVRPWDGSTEHRIDFGEPTYDAWIGQNPEFDTATLRFGYASLTTPRSTYDYDMNSRDRELRKRDIVLGGFDPDNYQAERLYATARDGTAVPISLVYRKDLRKPEGNPLLLYGYGSYGSSVDANFRSSRLTLIDRGFVFAMAHIRGGQEMGRAWYEDGKLLNKKNTFTDFIDCGQHLVAAGYTTPDMLYGSGGSAGGLLIGAVVNMAPELWNGVYTRVPFVDVITTMLDPDIPLTTSEYDEWGNPNEKTYYDYMLSYSPYDQVEAQDYPHILVTTGLHDSQVQYWEPAKWVAKLRALKTDDQRLLLKTNMAAGHGGASGRYERYRETAFNYAFLLDLAGLTGVSLPDPVQ